MRNIYTPLFFLCALHYCFRLTTVSESKFYIIVIVWEISPVFWTSDLEQERSNVRRMERQILR